MKSKLKSLPYYPLLFAISPVLSLYARNTSEVAIQDVLFPVAAMAAIAATVCVLAFWVSRDVNRAALVSVTFTAFFFLYRPFSRLAMATVPGWTYPRHDRIVLLPLLGVLFLCYAAYIVRTPRRITGITSFLQAVAGILTTVIVATLLYRGITTGWSVRQNPGAESTEPITAAPPLSDAGPDIYYIILDGYARRDVLIEYYGWDNADFLGELEAMGFVVAQNSRANYSQTLLSLTSSLNMSHIADLLSVTEREEGIRSDLVPLLRNSIVIDYLRDRGYTLVAFETGYTPTNITSADVFMYEPQPTAFANPFAEITLRWTPLGAMLYDGTFSIWSIERSRIRYTLQNLPSVASTPGPKMVFAHIKCPHPPFMFGADGQDVTPRVLLTTDGDSLVREGGLTRTEYQEGYVGQTQFISSEILQTLKSIIAGAPSPPVIILQADHGPGSMLKTNDLVETNMRERLSILNAYLLPGVDTNVLYDSITPVNSFRIVLNEYFGESYDLLPDTSYFAPWDEPFMLTDVTARASGQ